MALGYGYSEGKRSTVVTYITTGLPGFDVIGWPSDTVKEIRDRVRAEVLKYGYTWPQFRITVDAGGHESSPETDKLIFSAVLRASGFGV
jgi:magnesium chelatase family protein